MDDEPLDVDVTPADPVADFGERLAFERAAGGPLEPGASLLKCAHAFENRFAANRENPPFGTAATLATHAARTEEKAGPDGSLWKYDYDTAGELVSACQIDTDGGPLAKVDRIDFSDIDADAKLYAALLKKEWGLDEPEASEI
jgi:hypothetical protein